MTTVFSGGRIEDYYAPITVSISYEEFVGTGFHEEIRRATQMSRIIASHVDPRFTDGEDVFPFSRELHHVKSIARAEPNEPIVIDVYAVLLVNPRIALSRTTPSL